MIESRGSRSLGLLGDLGELCRRLRSLQPSWSFGFQVTTTATSDTSPVLNGVSAAASNVNRQSPTGLVPSSGFQASPRRVLATPVVSASAVPLTVPRSTWQQGDPIGG